MAAFGLSEDDYDDAIPTIKVWPDNWLVVRVFQTLSTQWRTGMTGPTGLDYAVLPAVMQLEGVRKKDRADTFDGLRVMESAALSVIHKKE